MIPGTAKMGISRTVQSVFAPTLCAQPAAAQVPALFLTEAAKYQVFPLDNSAFTRLVTPRPSTTAGRTVFTYSGENAGIPVANAPSILDKDYTITAEVTG